MANINDPHANSGSNFVNRDFSSSMGIKIINDPNNTSRVHICSDLSTMILFVCPQSNGAFSRTIFGEDIFYESSRFFSDRRVGNSVGDVRLDNIIFAPLGVTSDYVSSVGLFLIIGISSGNDKILQSFINMHRITQGCDPNEVEIRFQMEFLKVSSVVRWHCLSTETPIDLSLRESNSANQYH